MNRKSNFQKFILILALILLAGPTQSAMVQAEVVSKPPDPPVLIPHDETGFASFISAGESSTIEVQGATAAALRPAERAALYLDAYGGMFGLQDARNDLALNSEALNADRWTFKYQQVYQGVPVFAGEIIVNTDAQGKMTSMSGEVSPDLDLAVVPEITAAEAQQNALGAVAKGQGVDVSDLNVSEAELWIFDEQLVLPSTRPVELVWRVEVSSLTGAPIRELVLVNAARGGISLNFNQVDTIWSGQQALDGEAPVLSGNQAPLDVVYAADMATYTAQNTTSLPGTFLCDETTFPCTGGSDTHADNAHAYAFDTYQFYYDHHGRDSIDGAGMQLVSTVHYDSGYPNAFWDGTQMVYGDAYGFPNADDVVAHELTHGVTDYESGLLYYYESGAISEALSDLWGEFVDLNNGAGNDTSGVRWYAGEDITGIGAIRNMANPPEFGDPDKMTSANYHLGDWDARPFDNGGVHYNSGVNNKAVYLMVDGDTFNSQTVTGIGIDKVAAIYYEVLTSLLFSGSNYHDLYYAVQQACSNLIGGAEGITAGDCTEVKKALDAVEMDQEPIPGFNTDAAICPSGQVPADIFYDGFEDTLANWTIMSFNSDYGVVDSWVQDWGYATGGIYMLYGWDYQGGEAIPDVAGLEMYARTDPIAIPVTGPTYLHFDHFFEFETPDWDGGLVQYSVNGGPWQDLGPLHVDGMDYNGTINAGYINPNAGSPAFIGTSHGYLSSKYDVSSLAGSNVEFQWVTSTDDIVWATGWLLDEVRVYNCVTTSNNDTIGLYNSTYAAYYLKTVNEGGAPDIVFQYGATDPTWIPLMGDWNGDGTDTVGVYVPSLSIFFLKDTNAGGASDYSIQYGPPGAGWIPLVGDWDGDGDDTLGLFDPTYSAFFLANELAGGAIPPVFYGAPGLGWTPLVGDWDGDGDDTLGLYDPTYSVFYLSNELVGGSTPPIFYGASTWTPIVGDWDGDGDDTIGVYVPSSSLFFLKNSNETGTSDLGFQYGPAGAGWLPLVGNYE